MLEVVGIRGVVHMGQISGGLSNAIRLAQGGRVYYNTNDLIKKDYFLFCEFDFKHAT
jgi:hypothetical protein